MCEKEFELIAKIHKLCQSETQFAYDRFDNVDVIVEKCIRLDRVIDEINDLCEYYLP